MHGQAKIKASKEDEEKKKKEQEIKVQKYKSAMSQALSMREEEQFDEEALGILNEFLSSNPDTYSMWNFRKEILLKLKELRNNEELFRLLKGELHLTEVCLKANPKSYCVWHHRLWLMDNMPEVDLKTELDLCTKFLKFDERNFHCWDHRREIANRLGISSKDELDFTMTKIGENFSNYSSWHYRSKLLPIVHPDTFHIWPIDQETHLKELEMVMSAAYTDPSDQSAWFYQRWLLGMGLNSRKRVESESNGNEAIACSIWVGEGIALLSHSSPLLPTIHGLGHPSTWQPLSSRVLMKDMEDEEEVEEPPRLRVEVGEEMAEEIELGGDRPPFMWSREPLFQPPTSNSQFKFVLEDQLESANQLLAIEPGNKWTLLTSVLLMQSINRKKYNGEIMSRIEELITVDPYRINYYLDMRSKLRLEQSLEEGQRCELRGLGLTRLYHIEWLILLTFLNLSDNELPSTSLPVLRPLQCLRILILDGNQLKTLEGFPRLSKLEELSVKGNQLGSWKEVEGAPASCHLLSSFDISENPIPLSDLQSLVSTYPHLDILHNLIS